MNLQEAICAIGKITESQDAVILEPPSSGSVERLQEQLGKDFSQALEAWANSDEPFLKGDRSLKLSVHGQAGKLN